ncbi:MAG: hypothetical protein BJ554DRAFT_7210 [Olpidium bornovanus]|uniref:Uncharacterized protein n=1 Tax=Olpidium bornovanus TaxID=278681 RepID=A0A8H8DJG2_9FUNG|nr:MAG: hypothetical protein BJ554DRAFT_7210 [Olpidium bornovanus]
MDLSTRISRHVQWPKSRPADLLRIKSVWLALRSHSNTPPRARHFRHCCQWGSATCATITGETKSQLGS